tara:strand:- start:105 stop:266 length:162 start_codon:yes stop_codon:yes gene_type:complete
MIHQDYEACPQSTRNKIALFQSLNGTLKTACYDEKYKKELIPALNAALLRYRF